MKHLYFLFITYLLIVESALGQDKLERNTLLECVQSGNAHCVQLAIETKDDLNFIDEFGNTPIVYAVRRGDKNIIKMLLDAQADRTAHTGEPLLFIATSSTCNNPEIFPMLLSYEEGVNITNQEGQTLLSKVTAYYEIYEGERKSNCKEVIQILLDAGAEVDQFSQWTVENILNSEKIEEENDFLGCIKAVFQVIMQIGEETTKILSECFRL